MPHKPVLLSEVVERLAVRSGQAVLDGTVGYGGHAQALLEAAGGSLIYIGLDRDKDALAYAHKRLRCFRGVRLVQASYAQAREILKDYSVPALDAVLLDLGASSPQFDEAKRGFSFQKDGPLDMRFDVSSTEKTAADILNTYREQELARIIHEFGEERFAKRIAKAIAAQRKAELFSRTEQLRTLIERTIPRRSWPKHIHPATRTFQALRIETNKELDTLAAALPQLVTALKPGGKLAVISFHSLEDRVVKQFFRDQSLDCVCPKEVPICTCNTVPRLRILTKKPVSATPAEQKQNPRSRSAKLRVAQKI